MKIFFIVYWYLLQRCQLNISAYSQKSKKTQFMRKSGKVTINQNFVPLLDCNTTRIRKQLEDSQILVNYNIVKESNLLLMLPFLGRTEEIKWETFAEQLPLRARQSSDRVWLKGHIFIDCMALLLASMAHWQIACSSFGKAEALRSTSNLIGT